jgi:hypothetical protein
VGGHIKKTDRRRSKRKNIDIHIGGHPTSNPANQFWDGKEEGCAMKNIFFSFIFLMLLGCQSQEKTDFERGYEAGERNMAHTFWKRLDAESDLWIAWENESVINREEGQQIKIWGAIIGAFGLFVFFVSSFFAKHEIRKMKEEKEKAEKEVFKLLNGAEEAKKAIVLAETAKSEQQLIEANIRDLDDEKELLQKDIENLIIVKSKAESDFILAKQKLDEISI